MSPIRARRILIGLLAALGGVLIGRATPAEPVDGTFDAHGVTLHYTVRGSGEPVVLVHGLLASGWLNWDLPGVTAAVAKKYQVIALDLPGHGSSDKPEKADAYGVQMVEDVVLLLDRLKIKKAHIVGYSLGGMITVKLLTLHPDRVLSATVGGMGWVRDRGRNLGLRGPVPAGKDSGALTYVVNGMGDLAVNRDELKAIRVPVGVIIGDQDPLERATVEPLRTVRPDWPVVEIKNAGHMNCVLKKEFVDAIVTWLDKNRQN